MTSASRCFQFHGCSPQRGRKANIWSSLLPIRWPFKQPPWLSLHGSHGPVSREIPPSNEVLLKRVWRRTPMQTCSRILIVPVKNFFFPPFSAFWAEFKARQRQTQRIVDHVMMSNKLKGELKRLNRLTFHPNHVRVHPYFPHDFEQRFVVTGATLFTSDVGGLENGFGLRPLSQGVLWSLKLVEYLSISI